MRKSRSIERIKLAYFDVKICCDILEIGYEEIKSPRKPNELVFKRHAIAFFMHDRLGYKFPEIAQVIKRDRSTVRHSVEVVGDQMPLFRKDQERLKEGFNRKVREVVAA